MSTLFVSSAIPYVNAPPHLGFALEAILADVIARHGRARGEETVFVSGTDDHSLSNVRAADARGIAVQELVDDNGARFRALGPLLHLSFDEFVRTSRDPRHRAAVHALWSACAERGDLERRAYRGLYCTGCERFCDPEELEGGRCAEHAAVPELVEEENWFFLLSKYEGAIRNALASGRLRIEPAERAREVERFLERGLRDVSASRSRTRGRGWGIEVPGDPDQTVWVWFDALANYIAALGYPGDTARFASCWTGAERRIHVLGKGIARFHALVWPAILAAAGLELPTTLLVHGYLTVGGRKIGKSQGNAIDPELVARRFGIDALRYFLLRHVGPANDADFDEARLTAVYRAELADGLGNLVARTLALVKRHGAVRSSEAPPVALVDEAGALAENVDRALLRLAPDEALRAIWRVVAAANKYLADTAPWTLLPDLAKRAEAGAILAAVVVALEAIARSLVPLLPATAQAIAGALARPDERPPILFPKEPASSR